MCRLISVLVLYDVSKCENIYVQLSDVNHWNCYELKLASAFDQLRF